MDVAPGSSCGAKSSAETMHGTHVLDPTQNTIKCALLKKCTMNDKW
jgi:hypothetical protein